MKENWICMTCGLGFPTQEALKSHQSMEKMQAGSQGIETPSRTDSAPGEVVVTDPLTGGKKGAKLARFSLIPWDFLWALAEHYGIGSKKYEDRNWEKGYKWSLSLDAHGRHLSQWLGGEDNDPETGSSHLVAAAWHLVALWWFHRHGRGTDDIRTQPTE